MKKRTKESKKRLNSLILLVAFSAILLIASTYAWFTAQNDVYITNLEGKVEVVEGIEISLDGIGWGQTIDFTKITDVTSTERNSDNMAAWEGNNNIQPSELLPVSIPGTSAANSNKYLDVIYAETGNVSGNVGLVSAEEVDEEGTGENAPDYFYAFDVFFRNTSRESGSDNIYLNKKSAVTVLNNANGGLYSTRNSNAESGLQNTVRVGFAQYGTTIDSGSDEATIKTFVSNSANTISSVSIWEPNANYHVNNIVGSYNKKVSTPEAAPVELSTSKVLKTYALKSSTSKLANIYDYATGDEANKVSEQKTTQTTVAVDGSGKVSDYFLAANADLKDLTGNNFALPRNKIIKMRMYIWLEGQDIDCFNWASTGGGIEVNLGIEKAARESN